MSPAAATLGSSAHSDSSNIPTKKSESYQNPARVCNNLLKLWPSFPDAFRIKRFAPDGPIHTHSVGYLIEV
jgi:hypothetical protein